MEEGAAAEDGRQTTSCLGRAAVPVKRVWRGLSARLGLTRRRRASTGLGRLRKDVRTCEYSDVHVMWEMLSSSSSSSGGGGKQGKATTTTTVAGRRKAGWPPAALSARRTRADAEHQ